MGNLKFDISLPFEQIEAGRTWNRSVDRAVVAIASTREGEDALFVNALADARGVPGGQPGPALYMLIPRHPQRFDEAALLLRTRELSFVRRSTFHAVPGANIDALLGESLREMAFYYAASDVAIVAGSLAPHGGQNLIEACVVGTPVIIGPHTFNFAQEAEDAVLAGAAIRVENVD